MSNKKKKNTKKKQQEPVKSKAQLKAEEEAHAKEFKKKAIIVCTALVLIIATVITLCTVFSKKHKGAYYVEMTVENYGTIILKLDCKAAPKTVKNFVRLVKKDFYNGLTFHRVIEDFMIQGGDPKANGTGDSGREIIGEFSSNGYYNPINHERGVISMARGEDPNSASCQFFIVHETSPHLDGNYAAFGYVIKGMDVVDKIVEKTAIFGNSNGLISDKSKQAVISEMKLIYYRDIK